MVEKDKGDLELAAMAKVKEALGGLEADSRQRVMSWAIDLFSLVRATPSKKGSDPTPLKDGDDQDIHRQQGQVFEDAATLFTTTNPQGKGDMALVVAYWFQVIQKDAEFGSQKINNQLKNLGRPDSKINRTFLDLMKQTPALVMQTHRGGKSQQARKTYKLTQAGIERVKALLAAARGGA
jgi:hypothetical protein